MYSNAQWRRRYDDYHYLVLAAAFVELDKQENADVQLLMNDYSEDVRYWGGRLIWHIVAHVQYTWSVCVRDHSNVSRLRSGQEAKCT